jgi:hypothetical protein
MVAPDIPGLATKNFDSGMEVPAAVPLVQESTSLFLVMNGC